MNKKIFLFVLGMLMFSTAVSAQPGFMHSMDKNKKVIIQLRNLELLKTLDLSDEQSMRVLPIIKDIDNLMSDSFESHRIIIENLEKALKDNDKNGITKNTNLLISQEVEHNKKKAVLYKKLREELGEEKFAKYLIFMKRFGKELQDKIRMMREGDKFQSHPKIDKNK